MLYFDRYALTPERVNHTVSKLALQARINREAAAYARRLAASPLVGRVATCALKEQLAALAPDKTVYFSIRERDPRERYVGVIDQGVCASVSERSFEVVLATNAERRIDRDKLLAQAKRFDSAAAEYTRRASELPAQAAQINNLLPYLLTLEDAAQTVSSYAPAWNF